MPARLLLLLAPLLVAGCAGSDDGGSAGPEARPEPSPLAPAAGVAADANATGPVETPADPANGTATFPLAWDGHIGRSACLPSGPGACTSPDLDGEGVALLVLEPRPARIVGTLTWTEAAPTTKELSIELLALRPCGEGCVESRVVGNRSSGHSPLPFEREALDLAEDEALVLSVSPLNACREAAVLHGCASLVEQDFRVEGTMVVPARHEA